MFHCDLWIVLSDYYLDASSLLFLTYIHICNLYIEACLQFPQRYLLIVHFNYSILDFLQDFELVMTFSLLLSGVF